MSRMQLSHAIFNLMKNNGTLTKIKQVKLALNLM